MATYPNHLSLVEKEKRWEFADHWSSVTGFRRHSRLINRCTRCSELPKVAADIMVQEYGRYFGMPTCVLRGGCLTGPNHAGVELHGFLSYLVRCNLIGTEYKVFGYKGKQVRDNLHSERCGKIHAGICPESPLQRGVQPRGIGFENSCSIIEAFEMTERRHRPQADLDICRRQSRRRSYLLLQRSQEDEGALSELGRNPRLSNRQSPRSLHHGQREW